MSEKKKERACPCVQATGRPDPYWHIQRPDAPNCAGTGELGEAAEELLNQRDELQKEQCFTRTKFGFVGIGAAGDRFSECFHYLGYPVVAINTSDNDLTPIKIPEEYKLLIKESLHGAGQDAKMGESAALSHRDVIKKHIQNNFIDTVDKVIVAIGAGGGTGSGAIAEVIKILKELDYPVGVITTLPKIKGEGTTVKTNALSVLEAMNELAQAGKIAPFIVVDNNRIGEIYPQLSIIQHYQVANLVTSRGFDVFNKFSSQPSEFMAFDPADYERLLSIGGCCAFAEAFVLPKSSPDDLIAGIAASFQDGLLNAFDLTKAKAVGIIFSSSRENLQQLPATSVDTVSEQILQLIGGGTMFKGIYADKSLVDKLVIYSMFTGLDLPSDRIATLRAAVKKEQSKVLAKSGTTN